MYSCISEKICGHLCEKNKSGNLSTNIRATGPLTQATRPPYSGAGVGVGMFRGFMVSWESQRFEKLICQRYKDCDRYGVHWPIFGEKIGSSRNDPKRFGICPGTLISYF